jgi:hypothetical protein
LALGSAFDRRQKTAGFDASSIHAKVPHDLIPFASRISVVVFQARQPTFKASGVEVPAVALFDVPLERLQHPSFMQVAMSQRALMVEESVGHTGQS